MNSGIKIAAAVFLTMVLYAGNALADTGKPTELNANTVEYDTSSGVITATGNVVMIQESSRISGAQAVYNSKTSEGHITGNVVADKENLHMTANEVFTQGSNMLIANGNVVAHQLDKTISGPRLEYNSDTNYALMPNSGTIVTAEGTITGNRLEAYLQDNHFIAVGNVHITSQTRNIDAYSNNADYYGNDNNKVILTGNAVAMQDNNTLRGEKLTLYLNDTGQAAVK
ncbi:LptA/OstA family protein [Pectinatus haikarae]|nr:LptA/OstA family protein [Pectinatus haikarae]